MRQLPWLLLLCGLAIAFALVARGMPATQVNLLAQGGAPPVLQVPGIQDFAVNGRGDDKAWEAVPWTTLDARHGVANAPLTRIKVAWSPMGVYVLMDAADTRLTATFEEDFSDLWKEDVFEAFLWPDQRDTIYFEYEVSPLGRELPILIPNLDEKFLGWRPWHYGGDRRVRHATSIVGGPKQSGATIKGWRAEVMIPFALLSPLRSVPPTRGARWRANFYRVDYDGGKAVQWDWARVETSFHDFRKFGTLEFQ
jgi:Carbohydrate family 9 binding domain-like